MNVAYWATRTAILAIGFVWLAFDNWRGDPSIRRARRTVQRRRRNEGRQR
jgi:hypothetical protein